MAQAAVCNNFFDSVRRFREIPEHVLVLAEKLYEKLSDANKLWGKRYAMGDNIGSSLVLGLFTGPILLSRVLSYLFPGFHINLYKTLGPDNKDILAMLLWAAATLLILPLCVVWRRYRYSAALREKIEDIERFCVVRGGSQPPRGEESLGTAISFIRAHEPELVKKFEVYLLPPWERQSA